MIHDILMVGFATVIFVGMFLFAKMFLRQEQEDE